MTKQPIGWFYEDGEEFTQCPERARYLREQGVELIVVYGAAKPNMRLIVGVLLTTIVVSGWLTISDNLQAQAKVDAQVADLAHRADTEFTPPVFAAPGEVEDHCLDVLYQLKKHGYALETHQKLLTTVVDMGGACTAREQITIRPK